MVIVHDMAHNFLQSSLGNAGPSSVVLIWQQAVFTHFPTLNEQLSQYGFTCDEGVSFNFLPSVTLIHSGLEVGVRRHSSAQV